MIREETLIEKVIWLIEDSYPDTNEWGHDKLVENIKKDLVTRANELSQMFGDEKSESSWHKVSEELPKEDDVYYVAGTGFYDKANWCKGEWRNFPAHITHWMEIPEIKEEKK